MKVTDMHTKTAKDLERHAEKLRTRLNETRSKIGVEEVKDIRSLRRDRRELAAALTIAAGKKEQEE